MWCGRSYAIIERAERCGVNLHHGDHHHIASHHDHHL
jgi:hypothetical protein